MNASLGKLGQTRVNQEIIIDDIEKCEKYLENNYKVNRDRDWETT